MIRFKSTNLSTTLLLLLMSTPLLLLPQQGRTEIHSSHAALGLGGVWTSKGQQDLGYTLAVPEVVGFLYSPLKDEIWLRYGARLSYAWGQPSMPQSLRINEYDLKAGAEVGFLYNWSVIPSLTFGTGVIYRTTSLEANGPISLANDPISGKSVLPYLQTQLGVGIPIHQGWLVLEPYVRYSHVFDDHRLRWALGTEATFSLY